MQETHLPKGPYCVPKTITSYDPRGQSMLAICAMREVDSVGVPVRKSPECKWFYARKIIKKMLNEIVEIAFTGTPTESLEISRSSC